MTIANFQSVILPDYNLFANENSELLPQYQIVIEKFKEFAKNRGESMPFLPVQIKSRYKPRIELDLAWLKIIGYNEAESEKIIDQLYDWLLDYIEYR
jgi:hypothetical protein